MFKGKFSLLFFFTVFVIFLFFFNTTNEASSSLLKGVSEHLDPIIEKIEAGPGVPDPEVKKQKLALKIHEEYGELKILFESDDTKKAKKMAKILGKKATLVVGSQTYYGNKQIRDFWNSIKDDYQSVVFTLDSAIIYFEEIEEIEDFDHIAYEFFTFKLFKVQAGKILKNQDGHGGRSCRHIHGCECRTR
jgi:hypothetical protein